MTNEVYYDHARDGCDFERYQETKQEAESTIDSTMDELTDAIFNRAKAFSGSCGIDAYSGEGFAKIVSTIARAALTIEAISGLILQHINDQLGTVKIQTIRAILSLVKSEKPHLTIDVIEHVFGLSKDKEADIARRYDIDRQVVSKRVVKLRNQFGLTSLRKTETSDIYRRNRLEQYQSARKKLQEIKS